jgi:hypothetical protein
VTAALFALAVVDAACCLSVCRDRRRLRHLEQRVAAATDVGAVLARARGSERQVFNPEHLAPVRHLRVVP